MKSKLVALFKRLHREERGDIPVGQLAIIGLITIPLVMALVAFGDEILKFVKDAMDLLTGSQKPHYPAGN